MDYSNNAYTLNNNALGQRANFPAAVIPFPYLEH